MKNFASVFPLIDHPVDIEGEEKHITSPGLTLRQLYAGMHIMGQEANSITESIDTGRAFAIADEMIQFEVDEMKKEAKDEE